LRILYIDLVYYESPPGLQLLHFAKSSPSIEGGESVLIDAFAAASHLRQTHRWAFDALTRTTATFVKQRVGANLVYRAPHIRCLGGEIVDVRWAPPFEGPLALSQDGKEEVDPDQIDEYYEAYKIFESLVDKDRGGAYAMDHAWVNRMAEGEMLVFNNRRLLHARNSFTNVEGGERKLIGCYANIDDALNVWRVGMRKRGGVVGETATKMKNVGNGTSIF